MTWTDGVVAKLDVGLDTGGGGGILGVCEHRKVAYS